MRVWLIRKWAINEIPAQVHCISKRYDDVILPGLLTPGARSLYRNRSTNFLNFEAGITTMTCLNLVRISSILCLNSSSRRADSKTVFTFAVARKMAELWLLSECEFRTLSFRKVGGATGLPYGALLLKSPWICPMDTHDFDEASEAKRFVMHPCLIIYVWIWQTCLYRDLAHIPWRNWKGREN